MTAKKTTTKKPTKTSKPKKPTVMSDKNTIRDKSRKSATKAQLASEAVKSKAVSLVTKDEVDSPAKVVNPKIRPHVVASLSKLPLLNRFFYYCEEPGHDHLHRLFAHTKAMHSSVHYSIDEIRAAYPVLGDKNTDELACTIVEPRLVHLQLWARNPHRYRTFSFYECSRCGNYHNISQPIQNCQHNFAYTNDEIMLARRFLPAYWRHYRQPFYTSCLEKSDAQNKWLTESAAPFDRITSDITLEGAIYLAAWAKKQPINLLGREITDVFTLFYSNIGYVHFYDWLYNDPGALRILIDMDLRNEVQLLCDLPPKDKVARYVKYVGDYKAPRSGSEKASLPPHA